MTANSPAYAIQASSHSAQLFRQAISTLLGTAGGIVDAGDYLVTQNGAPNMSVNVAGGIPGGRIWVPGTTSANVQGLYYGFNDAVVNVPIAASNPSNPRIDIIVAQVQDAAYAGAVNSFQIAAVTGTPAGSPVAPATPASSLKLANVAVAALATTIITANITDTRTTVTMSPQTLAQTAAAVKADWEYAYSGYKLLQYLNNQCAASFGPATYVALIGSGAMIQVGNPAAAAAITYLDPAEFAAGSRTTRYRLKVNLATNTTAPAVNYVFGLYPVSASAGGPSQLTQTLGAVVAGSTVTFNAPGASSLLQGNSGDFTAPVAGYYVLGATISAATAANASIQAGMQLEMRQT